MTKSTKKGVAFLILFALPFAAVGTFVAYLAASMIWTWARAQTWEETPARIVHAELHTSSDSDGGTTYRVEAIFEYSYMGTAYSSDQVGLGGFGSDNIGSFHQDKYRELRTYRDSGSDFRCFVNPNDPPEAILYREMRWLLLGFEAIFALVFCGVGYGLMFGSIYGGRAVSAAEKLREQNPEQPWRWKEEWLEGRIRGGAKGKMIGAIIFATLWNLISAPVVFFVPGEIASGNRLALIAFIFPAVGMLLLWWAIYAVLQWRKFGKSVFEMSSVPGVLGGYLEGHINTAVRTHPEDGFELTLSCIRRETSGSGDNRSTHEKVLWQDTTLVPREQLLSGPFGATIPVRFGIPYDAGPESDPEDDEAISWKLQAKAAVPGVDYSGEFEVPIFRTEDSDPGLVVEAGEEVADRTRLDPVEEMRDAGIVAEPLPAGGKRVVFGRARQKGAAFGLTLFTIIWLGIVWVMIEYDVPIFFPIVFGLFAIFMVYASLDMWLTVSAVEIADGTLTLTKGMLFAKRRIFRRDEVASIEPSRGMQSGNKLYYRIELKTKEGKRHILASRLDDQRLAKRLIKDFEAALAA